MPGVALSTDMIVGFPGETEADFDDTMTLTGAVRYHSMFSFKYSPRPNTLAVKRLPDDVPEPEKTRRIVALTGAAAGHPDRINERMVGTVRTRARSTPEPTPRVGSIGPHEHERRGQSSRTR